MTPGLDVQPVDPTRPHRVRDTAGSRIWLAYEQVRAYEAVLKWADVPTLHQLRIEAKRLRYTLEFVREALGPEGPALISRVVALQDHLGAMNDAEVAAHMARTFLVEHSGQLSDVESAAIGRYLVAREREVARLQADRRRALAGGRRAHLPPRAGSDPGGPLTESYPDRSGRVIAVRRSRQAWPSRAIARTSPSRIPYSEIRIRSRP